MGASFTKFIWKERKFRRRHDEEKEKRQRKRKLNNILILNTLILSIRSYLHHCYNNNHSHSHNIFIYMDESHDIEIKKKGRTYVVFFVFCRTIWIVRQFSDVFFPFLLYFFFLFPVLNATTKYCLGIGRFLVHTSRNI